MSTDKKNCKLGSACGASCISKKDTCQITASPKSSRQLGKLANLARLDEKQLAKVALAKERNPQLSLLEAAALRHWVSSDYTDITKALLADKPEDFALLDEMKSGLAKMPKANTLNIAKEIKNYNKSVSPTGFDINTLNRGLNIADRSQFTQESFDKAFNAFSYAKPSENVFAQFANVLITMKRDSKTEGRLVDSLKNHMFEGEILYAPGAKIKLGKTTINGKTFDTLAEASDAIAKAHSRDMLTIEATEYFD